MSLYYETAPFLSNSGQSGSLKSRVFNSKKTKCPATQIFALASEASLWSGVLTDVIDKAQLLQLERKLNPSLALLLVHDLLLNKRGISAPAKHPLRIVVEKHRARLKAEFTRLRVRKGLGSHEEFRQSVEDEFRNKLGSITGEEGPASTSHAATTLRWIRINTILSTLEEQLKTTFAEFRIVENLEEVYLFKKGIPQLPPLFVDHHIPNLLAVPRFSKLTTESAYINGILILQDKASCFPAYMLDPNPDEVSIDACAAPGNKTTHLAAIVSERSGGRLPSRPAIHACDRDEKRAEVLNSMVHGAGAQELVQVHAGRDFLTINQTQAPWCEAVSLLIDPSCSGSGIVGRDDSVPFVLPTSYENAKNVSAKKNRKQKQAPETRNSSQIEADDQMQQSELKSDKLQSRLISLSTFQLKLLLHAFSFPNAQRVVYSTCSVFPEENENVVVRALHHSGKEGLGWRLLWRDEQISGIQAWPIRGDHHAITGMSDYFNPAELSRIADACVRCQKGTAEGTQGFFVAGFVRETPGKIQSEAEEEWEGFGEISPS